MSELQGQMDIFGAVAEAARELPEGYDGQGNLINPAAEAASPEVETRLELAAAKINAIKAHVRRSTLAAAVEIGGELLAVRAEAPHGRWLAWLEKNVDYSERTAQNLIALYEEYGKGGNPQALADLSYTKAVALLALPAEQRDELIESGAAADMSTRMLQDEVRRLRQENAERQVSMAHLTAEAEAAKLDARRAREDAERDKAAYDKKLQAAEDAQAALKTQNSAFADRAAADAQRAADAVNRANESARALTEARRRIEDLESRPPEVVKETPDEVAAELEKLREQARRAPSEAVVRLRAGYERLLEDFRAVRAQLEAVKAEDAGTAGTYGGALDKAFAGMAQQIREVLEA